MRGEFHIYEPRKAGELVESGESPLVLTNQIVREGGQAYLKMLFQADNSLIAGGANFYVGAADQTPDDADTLLDISTEPTATNGYARQALARNSVDFPTVDTVNGVPRVESKIVTFTAAGGAFSAPISRLFLTSAASGTVGTLFSFTGPLNAAITLLDGNSLPSRYVLYLD